MKAFLVSVVFLGSRVGAHSIKQIVMDLSVEQERWECSFLMDATYALPEYRGDKSPAKSREWLIQQSTKNLERIQSETKKYIDQYFRLNLGDQQASYEYYFPNLEITPRYFPVEADGLAYIPVVLKGTYPANKGQVGVEWLAESGPGLLIRLNRNGEKGGLLSVGFKDKIALASLKGEGSILSAERAAKYIWVIDGFNALLPNSWVNLLVVICLVVITFIHVKNVSLMHFVYFSLSFILTTVLVASELVSVQIVFAKMLLLACVILCAYSFLTKKVWKASLLPLFLSAGAGSGIFAIQSYLDYYQNSSGLLPVKVYQALSFGFGGLIALSVACAIALLSLMWSKSFVAQKEVFRFFLLRFTAGCIIFTATVCCVADLIKTIR